MQHSGSSIVSSDLTDLTIQAISNQLQISVVLFTSLKNLPISILFPTHSVMLSPDPVLVAYMQGKFFAVKPVSSEAEQSGTNALEWKNVQLNPLQAQSQKDVLLVKRLSKASHVHIHSKSILAGAHALTHKERAGLNVDVKVVVTHMELNQ